MNKKTLGVCALALLAGCSLFTQRAPANPQQEIANAFASVFKEDTAMATLQSSPLPPETLTTGQISVVIRGHLSKVRTRDGGWIVQVPATGAEILEYDTTHGSAGAALNVRGDNTTAIHNQNLTLPTAVIPRDALIVTSTYNSSQGRAEYLNTPGRSAVDEMMPVVFVSYMARPGLFRPPAVGNNWLARFFRGAPLPEAAMDMSRLPSVIDIDNLPVNWTAWGGARPSIEFLTSLFRPFGGDCYDGWSTDTKTPDLQHPGYGTYHAGAVSQALVTLCGIESIEEKHPLALAIAQRGLDLVGAFSDGRYNYPNGGHSQGRKALVMTCGFLLKVRPFQNPNRFIGKQFQEDNAYRAGTWWFGGGWNAIWGFNTSAQFNGSMFSQHPSTWGDPNSPNHSTWAWAARGYIGQGCGCQIGTALAMHLMDLEEEMGVNYMRMIEQFMDGPPAAANEVLVGLGIDIDWGKDYAVTGGRNMCSEAWKLYHQ